MPITDDDARIKRERREYQENAELYQRRLAEALRRIPEEDLEKVVCPMQLWHATRIAAVIFGMLASVLAVLYVPYMIARASESPSLFADFHARLVSALVVVSLLGAGGALLIQKVSRRSWSKTVARLQSEGKLPDFVFSAIFAEEEAGAWIEETQKVHLESQKRRGTPWWRLELSGLHLAVWLASIAGALILSAPGHIYVVFEVAVVVFAFLGLMAKAVYWLSWIFSQASERVELLRLYRWAGTTAGTLYPIAAFGGIALLMVLGFYLLDHLFGD